MNIVFNSGRPYTDKGQRIAARVVRLNSSRDAVIAMVDIDRNIEGTYVCICTDKPTARDVLSAYDNNMRLYWDDEVPQNSPAWEELRAAARAL